MRRAAFTALVTLVGVAPVEGCASVLGVDMTYELVDAGASDAGVEGGASESGATVSRIRCATNDSVYCEAGTEECCFTGTEDLSCVDRRASDPCPQGTDIVCDDPSDCPNGDVCCMQLDTSNDVLGTSCISGGCPSGETELCASDSGMCSVGQCEALGVMPVPPFSPSWFYGCK
jgi:hypothetical protein